MFFLEPKSGGRGVEKKREEDDDKSLVSSSLPPRLSFHTPTPFNRLPPQPPRCDVPTLSPLLCFVQNLLSCVLLVLHLLSRKRKNVKRKAAREDGRNKSGKGPTGREVPIVCSLLERTKR